MANFSYALAKKLYIELYVWGKKRRQQNEIWYKTTKGNNMICREHDGVVNLSEGQRVCWMMW